MCYYQLVQKVVFVSVDGRWSDWSEYSSCTATCDGGQKQRVRACSNPAPANGGQDCEGDDEEIASCNTNSCTGEIVL